MNVYKHHIEFKIRSFYCKECTAYAICTKSYSPSGEDFSKIDIKNPSHIRKIISIYDRTWGKVVRFNAFRTRNNRYIKCECIKNVLNNINFPEFFASSTVSEAQSFKVMLMVASLCANGHIKFNFQDIKSNYIRKTLTRIYNVTRHIRQEIFQSWHYK